MTRIVCISDLQVGSNLGIMPEKAWVSEREKEETPNRIQEALLKAYNETVRAWSKPDILVVNGDAIEGGQPRERGVPVWSTNSTDHVDAAAILIDKWQAKKAFVVRGTGYHVNTDGIPFEELLARKIKNGVKISLSGNNFSDYQLWLQPLDSNKVFFFAHHIETTKIFQYMATAPAREVAMHKLNADEISPTNEPPNVMVYSHRHMYVDSGFESGRRVFVTPGWQVQTPFGKKRSPAGAIAHIGALRFTTKGDDFEWELKTYKLPEFKARLVRV